MFEQNSLLVALIICLPAIAMAFQQSSYLVDYLFFVVALNRGVRRFVDYQNGYFNPYSIISLTPLIVGGLATAVVILELNRRYRRMGDLAISTIYLYGLAVGAAFLVGLLNVKFGAIYAMGDYIVPIGLIGFGALYYDRPLVINRWCNSVAASAVIVAGYGIWQFYTIPPWDAFWVKAVNFEGYLGSLEPTKMTLFSTMAERGPAATYLSSSLILLVLRPNTLWFLRWPCAVLITVAMLLTYARTGLVQAALACLAYPIINRGAGVVPLVGLILICVFFGGPILDRLPGMAAQRINSLSNIQDDGSFIGRLQLFSLALRMSFTQPFGLGIGSHGLAARVSSNASGAIGDSSGYLEALRTFGWLGFIVVGNVLRRSWNSSSVILTGPSVDPNVALFRAWFVGGLVAMFSGNWMFTATFFWVLAGYCLGQIDGNENEDIDD